jgi:hypothetical protein
MNKTADCRLARGAKRSREEGTRAAGCRTRWGVAEISDVIQAQEMNCCTVQHDAVGVSAPHVAP